MYGSSEYWDERYTLSEDSYEWYLSWQNIIEQAKLSFNPDSRALIIGCGISNLAIILKQSHNISSLNIDFSDVAITKMNIKNEFSCISYQKMDVLNMNFDNEFDYIFDKALFDSILCSQNPEANVTKLLSNVYKSLKITGLYIIVSFGLVRMRMSYLNSLDWHVDHITLSPHDTNPEGMNNVYNLYMCRKDCK